MKTLQVLNQFDYENELKSLCEYNCNNSFNEIYYIHFYNASGVVLSLQNVYRKYHKDINFINEQYETANTDIYAFYTKNMFVKRNKINFTRLENFHTTKTVTRFGIKEYVTDYYINIELENIQIERLNEINKETSKGCFDRYSNYKIDGFMYKTKDLTKTFHTEEEVNYSDFDRYNLENIIDIIEKCKNADARELYQSYINEGYKLTGYTRVNSYKNELRITNFIETYKNHARITLDNNISYLKTLIENRNVEALNYLLGSNLEKEDLQKRFLTEDK